MFDIGLKCNKCDKEYKSMVINYGGKMETIHTPNCNCWNVKCESQEKKIVDMERRQKFDRMIVNSNIPLRCRDTKFVFPEKNVEEYSDDGEMITRLEYMAVNTAISDAKCHFMANIFMLGTPGVGKTTAGCEILKVRMEQGYDTAYYQAAELAGDKKLCYGLLNVNTVFVDDIGVSKGEAFGGTLFWFLNCRMERGLPTIVSTNYSHENNLDIFGAPFMDRIGGFHKIVMIGKSRRGEQ